MKKLVLLLLSLVICFSLVLPALAATSDFKIENGVLTGYNGPGGDVAIPDGVTKIVSWAFSRCNTLTSVRIPASVTSIGTGAFVICNNLMSIDVDDGNLSYRSVDGVLFDYSLMSLLTFPNGRNGSYAVPDGVREIGKYAFSHSKALASVELPDSLTEIGEYAFSHCNALTNIWIPDGVTTIDSSAFENCGSLTRIRMPDGLTKIGGGAFGYCIALTSLEIPGGVKEIEDITFIDCKSLKSIEIPDGMAKIGSSAFSHCDMLESLVIPDSMKVIGNGAFQYCDALTDVYYSGSKEQWNTISFGSSNYPLRLATIHYNYKTAQESAVNVNVNGVAVKWTDASPFIDTNSRTMVPLRAVAEALGLTVEWDGAKREAIFTDGTKTIYFPIGSSTARTGDGGTVQMDTAAVIVNDRTYAPIRYLAEYFGFTIGWDGTSRTVMIQGTPRPSAQAGMDSATITLTTMNQTYYIEDYHDLGSGYGELTYDLANISDTSDLGNKINAALRSRYDQLLDGKELGNPFAGDKSKWRSTIVGKGSVAQNANGILSLSYVDSYSGYMMNGYGNYDVYGITVSLKTGELMHLSDLKTTDGRQVTFKMIADVVLPYYPNNNPPFTQIHRDLFMENELDELSFYIQGNQIIICIQAGQMAAAIEGSKEIPTGIYIQT